MAKYPSVNKTGAEDLEWAFRKKWISLANMVARRRKHSQIKRWNQDRKFYEYSPYHMARLLSYGVLGNWILISFHFKPKIPRICFSKIVAQLIRIYWPVLGVYMATQAKHQYNNNQHVFIIEFNCLHYQHNNHWSPIICIIRCRIISKARVCFLFLTLQLHGLFVITFDYFEAPISKSLCFKRQCFIVHLHT